jgi:hypothetical protein
MCNAKNRGGGGGGRSWSGRDLADWLEHLAIQVSGNVGLAVIP